MTRENLIQAIYENKDEWSCAYSCQYTMEEENPRDVCMKCAERLLTEYEQKIRAEALKPIQKLLDDWFFDRVDDPNWVLSQISICIFNKTKEQNNE